MIALLTSTANRVIDRLPGPVQTKLRSATLYQVGMLVGSNGLSGVLGLVQGLLLAKMLGVESYGKLAVIIVSMEIVNQVCDVRIWETVINFSTKFLKSNENGKVVGTAKLCYLIDGGSGILALLVMLGLAPFMARIALHDEQLGYLLILYAVGQLFITTNTTSEAFLQVFSAYSSLAIKRGIATIVRFSAVVGSLFLFDRGLKTVVIAMLVAQAFNGLATNWLAIKILRNRLPDARGTGIRDIREHWKPIVRLTWNTNLTGTLGILQQNGGAFLLSALTTPTQVAYFRFADLLMQPLAFVHQALYTVIYPKLTARVHRATDRDALKRLGQIELKRYGTAAFAVLVAGLMALLIAAELVSWGNYRPAIVIVAFMIPRDVLALTFIWLRPVQVAIGQAGVGNIARVAGALIWVGGSFLFVPNHGASASGALYLVAGLASVAIQGGAFLRYVSPPRDQDLVQSRATEA